MHEWHANCLIYRLAGKVTRCLSCTAAGPMQTLKWNADLPDSDFWCTIPMTKSYAAEDKENVSRNNNCTFKCKLLRSALDMQELTSITLLTCADVARRLEVWGSRSSSWELRLAVSTSLTLSLSFLFPLSAALSSAGAARGVFSDERCLQSQLYDLHV